MIITQTPLRISLLGGNTDFPDYFKEHGGRVLTTAIDKYIYCIVKERFDDLIYVNWSEKEVVSNVNDIKHGIVRECLKMVGITKGIEISYLSDVPSEGSGLGSSSAVAVGTLNALYTFVGLPQTYPNLSNGACLVEIEKLQKPIGVQDQIITAYGGFRYIRLGGDDHLVETLEGDLDKFNEYLMLFYTDRTRKADNILKGIQLDKKILDETKKIADEGYELLKEGKYSSFGGILNKYWELKKKLNSKVSDPQIDTMYKKARKAGATGGKIVGAGGGGFILLFVPLEKKEAVREAMKGHRELMFRFAKSGSKVILNI